MDTLWDLGFLSHISLSHLDVPSLGLGFPTCVMKVGPSGSFSLRFSVGELLGEGSQSFHFRACQSPMMMYAVWGVCVCLIFYIWMWS